MPPLTLTVSQITIAVMPGMVFVQPLIPAHMVCWHRGQRSRATVHRQPRFARHYTRSVEAVVQTLDVFLLGMRFGGQRTDLHCCPSSRLYPLPVACTMLPYALRSIHCQTLAQYGIRQAVLLPVTYYIGENFKPAKRVP